MRKTKIICTLGKSVENRMEELIVAGMNAARVNLSHETYEIHQKRIDELKRARKALGKPIPLIMDTKGPEIRTGPLEKTLKLKIGQEFVLACDDRTGSESCVSISYEDLYKYVKPMDNIFIDDGRIRLQVERIDGKRIISRVLAGGDLSSRKGINIPMVETHMEFLSLQDEQDIRFAMDNEFDHIALSFVSNGENVQKVRQILAKANHSDIRIIAKIENKNAIDNIDEIIEVCDGIMVARGDMGVEIPLDQVPVVQKKLIRKCYLKGKPVITATHMLESMTDSPVPTRAEVSDIANAVYDSTSALMLSGETAIGKYPVEAVRTMVRIIETTENDIDYKKKFFSEEWNNPQRKIVDAIGRSSTVAAFELKAKAILVITRTGNSARMISRYRPECPIIAIAIDKRVERQLNMSWGITPVYTEYISEAEKLFENAIGCARKTGLIRKNDTIVITAGLPTGIGGRTNMLKIHVVGETAL
ncbi:MAG: pyruvate kinase [Clostridia bacterium]